MRFVTQDSVGGASGFGSGAMMATIDAALPARSGRPTRDQAEARTATLLDHALDHFLERGFEQATIEAIAAQVSMTKRTVYARYPDKKALFLAAVSRGIVRLAPTAQSIAATRVEGLEDTLANIAKLRIHLVSTPQGLKLQRIINTESYRFPEIFTCYYDIAAVPTVTFLADLLRDETEAGRLAIDEPVLAANTFMSMVVGGPVRFAVAGNSLADDDVEARVSFGVRLFLQGARPR